MRRRGLIFRGEGEPEEIRLEGAGDSWVVTRRGQTLAVSMARLPDGRLSLLLPDGRQVSGRAIPVAAGEVEVVTARGGSRVRLADALTDRLSQAGASGPGAESGEQEVRALMPGRVLEVRVEKGQKVESGQVLLVLEAMKMQNEIRASAAGMVARCSVSAGQTVESQELMLQIVPVSSS